MDPLSVPRRLCFIPAHRIERCTGAIIGLCHARPPLERPCATTVPLGAASARVIAFSKRVTGTPPLLWPSIGCTDLLGRFPAQH
jgi:hypothetical protein